MVLTVCRFGDDILIALEGGLRLAHFAFGMTKGRDLRAVIPMRVPEKPTRNSRLQRSRVTSTFLRRPCATWRSTRMAPARCIALAIEKLAERQHCGLDFP